MSDANFDEHTQTGIGVMWGFSYVAFCIALIDSAEAGDGVRFFEDADPFQPEVIQTACRALRQIGRMAEAMYLETHAKESSQFVRFAMAHTFASSMSDHLSYSAISSACIVSGALARLELFRFLSDEVLTEVLLRVTRDHDRAFIKPFLDWLSGEEEILG